MMQLDPAGDRYDIAGIAARHLIRMSRYTHPEGAALAELCASGVDSKRIKALYPFAIEEHVPSMVAYFASGKMDDFDFLDGDAVQSLLSLPEHARAIAMDRVLGRLTSRINQSGNISLPSGSKATFSCRKALHQWGYLLIFLHLCATELQDEEFAHGSLLGQRLRWHESQIATLEQRLAQR